MTCTICDTPLTGGSDTYVVADAPVCYGCWCRCAEEDVEGVVRNREDAQEGERYAMGRMRRKAGFDIERSEG